MWWWCPVRTAFVLYVQGSDLQIFIAIDTLTEFAVGDYQLIAHCEIGHYLSSWHLSWKTGNNLLYPLFTFCCAMVITCSWWDLKHLYGHTTNMCYYKQTLWLRPAWTNLWVTRSIKLCVDMCIFHPCWTYLAS